MLALLLSALDKRLKKMKKMKVEILNYHVIRDIEQHNKYCAIIEFLLKRIKVVAVKSVFRSAKKNI